MCKQLLVPVSLAALGTVYQHPVCLVGTPAGVHWTNKQSIPHQP